MGTVNSLSGTLPATLTYSARKWFWVPAVPGAYADPRDGTLTIVLTEAAGGKIQRDSYGVAEEVAIGILGRRFLLMNDTDANQPDVYEVVAGQHPSCTCLGWMGGRAESCKHVDALGALAKRIGTGPLSGPFEELAPEESPKVVTVTATVVEPLALPAAAAPAPEPQPTALVPASTSRQDGPRPKRGRKTIAEKTVRVQENPVTHVLERTVLDNVQKAFERIGAFLDREMLQLNYGDGQRLVAKLEDRLKVMRPHTD